MRVITALSLVTITMLYFSGCGGEESSLPPEKKAETEGISQSEYDVKICTDKNRSDEGCEKARAFDPNKTVAVLSPPKDIGIGTTSYFDGDKFIVVSKDEKAISPYNMLTEGILAYIKSGNASWCGPCRMVNNIEDVKKLLEDEFKLDGSEKQNKAFLAAYSSNLDKFAGLGFEVKEAHQLSIESMVEKLLNFTQVNLSKLAPCDSDYTGGPCPSITADQITLSNVTDKILRISKDEASQKAYEKRDREDKLKPYEEVFDKLECKDNESKQIFMYGIADNFNTTNSEPTNPKPALLSVLNVYTPYGYVNPYDYFASINNPNFFAETLDNLPTNLTQGIIVLGLKEYGYRFTDTPSYQDIYEIGSIDNGLFQAQANNAIGMVSDIRTNWNSINTNIYFKDLSQIANPSGQSLLTRVQSGQNYLDIFFGITTNVDFIAVAACTPKEKPTGIPVPEIPDKLECKEAAGENLVQIWGGNGDDFVLPIDSANPPSIVSSHPSLIAYDESIVEKIGVFGDSLTLPTNSTITKAQLLVNTKAATQGSINDKIFFGNFTANKAGLYNPNSNGIATLNGGTAHIIDDLSPIYDTITQNQIGSFLSLLNSGISNLDVVVKDQTIVDSVRLSMCVVENPKEGDIGIKKKLVKQYNRDGLNYGIFEISFSGSLPANETLVVEDVVPNGANITHLSAIPWNCTPTPTIYSGSTMSCELTGAYSPIPPIILTMQTKGDTLTNCASITKGVDTYYNNNQENDRSCDTMTADPDPADPTLPESCKEKIQIDLSQAITWKDSAGNQPTVHNAVPSVWDNSYNWFNFAKTSNTDHLLKSEFCSCGGGSVKIEGLKTDNTGYIDLKNLGSNSTVRIVEQTQNSQATMASWGNVASGIANFPYSGNGVNYQLELGVHNYRSNSGGAVKGVLEFIGHKGRCNDTDTVDNGGGFKPIVLEEERIIVYPPIINPGTTTPGDVVVEPMGPLSKKVNGSIVIENNPLPIVISVDSDKVVAIDPDEFTGPIPSNLDPTVVFGCSGGHYRVAWLDEGGFHSYTSDVSCSPDWNVAF